MPLVEIPGPYTGPTRGAERLVVPGRTARECIWAIERDHPGFAPLIFDEDGSLQRFARLFVNGEPAAAETPLGDGDVLTILAALAGGI